MYKGKGSRIAAFLKRNIYYVVMVVCVLAIITMVTLALTLTLTEKQPDGIVDAGGTLVEGEDNNSVVVTPPPGEAAAPNTSDVPDATVPNVPESPVIADEEPISDVGAIENEGVLFIMPVSGGSIIKNYSATPVLNSTLNKHEAHKGIDIGGASGADVLAAFDGRVESISHDLLWGYQITILHDDNIRSIYKSVDGVLVSGGDTVAKGDKIAVISTSAGREKADGEHLHFAVTVDGVSVNPTEYMEPIN